MFNLLNKYIIISLTGLIIINNVSAQPDKGVNGFVTVREFVKQSCPLNNIFKADYYLYEYVWTICSNLSLLQYDLRKSDFGQYSLLLDKVKKLLTGYDRGVPEGEFSYSDNVYISTFIFFQFYNSQKDILEKEHRIDYLNLIKDNSEQLAGQLGFSLEEEDDGTFKVYYPHHSMAATLASTLAELSSQLLSNPLLKNDKQMTAYTQLLNEDSKSLMNMRGGDGQRNIDELTVKIITNFRANQEYIKKFRQVARESKSAVFDKLVAISRIIQLYVELKNIKKNKREL